MKKTFFNGQKGKLIRQAFNYAINRKAICEKIFDEKIVPTQIIPYGMPGYDNNLKGYDFSIETAKKLLQKAGNPKLGPIVILHTDGIKTIQAAKEIQKNLEKIGIKTSLKEIKYQDDDTWERELSKGEADLFLMGYKVPILPFEKNDPYSRIEKFVFELFHTNGEANMFFLSNKNIDFLINTLKDTPSKDQNTKDKILQKISRILYEDPVTVNIFYIREL